MLEIFQYDFMIRAFIAGILIGGICPLIGIFLVLRRYSLFADTLAHISLAGVAVGILARVNPIITAFLTSITASVLIERLRASQRLYGDSALALFLSGSLAFAITLISFAGGLNSSLLNYLFGSIISVRPQDIQIMAILGLLAVGMVFAFYKELLYVSFDEETAHVSGINTKLVNMILIALVATTISLSMRIVGILLISALIVIPVMSALQFKKSFIHTMIISEIVSVLSVVIGIFMSYYFNLAAGGVIVLVAIAFFCISLILRDRI